MCIPRSAVPTNFRSEFCRRAGMGSSTFKTGDGERLTFDLRSNGICVCYPNGMPQLARDCRVSNPHAGWHKPRPQPARVARNTDNDDAPAVNNRPKPKPRPSTPDNAQNSAAARAQAQRESEEERAAAAAAAAQAEAVRQAEQQAEQQAQAAAKACVDTEISRLTERCQEAATTASTSCKGTNTESGEQASSIRSDSNNLISTTARSSKDECDRSAAFAFGSHERVTTVRDNCATDEQSCRMSCGMVPSQVESGIMNGCGEAIGERPEILTYVREKVEAIGTGMESSKAICEQATTDLAGLNTMLNGVADAVQKSAMCSCMLSSGAGKNSRSGACNSIPSMESCAEDHSKPGCEVYLAVGVCSPESATFDAQSCQCQKFPSSPGCGGTVLSTQLAGGTEVLNNNGISAFAGPGSNTPVVPPGSGGGKSGSSSIDLGSKPDSSENSPLAFAPAAKGGTATGGTGSPGGVPTAGTGELQKSTPDPVAVEEADGGIKGMFGLAKSFISKAFTQSSGGNGDAKMAKSAKVDFNKFKPRRIRGIASEEEDGASLGKSNMDIWIMMNKCSGGESCRSNLNNYITTP